MTSFPRLILLSLLLTTLAGGYALGQVHQPLAPGFDGFGPGGHGPQGPGMGGGAGYYGSYGPQHAGGAAHVPYLGSSIFSINNAIDGLGYEGSYFSGQTTFPIGGMDPLHGWWLIDARVNISDKGLPFTNLGLVRRTHFRPMQADFGVGVYYDMDADEYEDFGHTFQQIGVSANMWTPHFDLNFNGYVPVGRTDYVQGSPEECFFENYIAIQHGLDSALSGFDFDFGYRPDWWAPRSGQFNLGVYAFQSDEVDAFTGFRGGFSVQPKPGLRLSAMMTADEEFDASGLLTIEFIRGRSRGLSPSGRDLDPMRRMPHIVRAHANPILATNPDTGELYRVVHVDNSAPEGGDGTFENPFNELSDADGTLAPVIREGGVNSQRFAEFPRSLPGDIIFVNEGLSRLDPGSLTPDDLTDDTPLDPTDDLPGNLTGYDTGIALLDGQFLLGDGVQHIIPTVEKGNFLLCNDIDGLTPYISNGIHFPTPTSGTQPNRAAVTLADDTTVRGFNIVNSEIGILAPDPTPTLNNNDGVAGNIVLERVNIFQNNLFDVNDLVRNTGDALDPDTATIDVPLKYGISILDSTATFDINNVNIKGQDVLLPVDIFDDGAGGTRVIEFSPEGNLVAALNVERGMPDINFNGTIDNTFKLIQQVVVDDGDPLTLDPILEVEFDTLSAGGRALRIVDTTGGTQFIDGLINNVAGQGIMIDNADDTMITVDSMVMINQSTTPSVTITDSDFSDFAFTNQVLITDPEEAGVLLSDNTDTEITFFDLQVTTPENQAARDAGLVLPNSPVTGFLAQRNSGGMISVTGKSFLDIVGGPALSLAGVDGDETPVDLNFTRLRSVDSDDGGVNLANVSGTVRSARTTVIDSAGTAIVATSNDGAPLFVDFGQTTINPSAGDAAAGIDPGFQGPGVFLQNNTGATFSFDQLLVTTGNGDPTLNTNVGGAAFRALDGGTINFNSVPVLTAVGGPVLELRNVTGTFQNAPGLVFDNLQTIQRNGAGIIIDGVTNDVLLTNVFIPNDRVDVNDEPNPAAGNAIDILNTAATGSTVTIENAEVDNFLNSGINIVDSLAVVRNSTIFADPTFDIDGDGTTPDLNSLDGISVTATNGNTSQVLIEGNTIQTISGSAVDVTVAATGTVELAMNNNTLGSLFGAGAIIDGSSGGSLTVTEMRDNVVAAVNLDPAAPADQRTGGGGILINEVVFDSDLAAAGLQQVQGGNTVIGNQDSPVVGPGLVLDDVEGELHFKNLDINNLGTTVLVDGSIPYAGTGLYVATPNSDFTLSTGAGRIITTNGPALLVDSTSVNLNLATVSSISPFDPVAGAAINLNAAAGNINIQRTTVLDGRTGISVTNTVNEALAVNFGNTRVTGDVIGSTVFPPNPADITDLGDQGDAIVLDNNPLADITFNGLVVFTSEGTGFRAQNGGNVNFTGDLPIIYANRGSAVVIDGSVRGFTNGQAGWTFNSLTSLGGTGPGVRLTNVDDDFTVTGLTTVSAVTAENAIQLGGTGGIGIHITGGTGDYSFNTVNVTRRGNVAIQIEDVAGDVFIGAADIDNARQLLDPTDNTGMTLVAAPAAGNAINILSTADNGGRVTINGGTITDTVGDAIFINNSLATIRNVTIDDPNLDPTTVFTGTRNGINVISTVDLVALAGGDPHVILEGNVANAVNGSGIDVRTQGAGTLIAVLNNNTGSSDFGAGIIVDASAGAAGSLIVTDFADNTVLQGAAGTGAGGILLRDITFDADTATAGLQAVDGGDTVIGTSAARVTGDGLTLQDIEGELNFKQLNIFNDTGTGLLVKNPMTNFTLVTGGGNINTTNGAAIDMDPTTIDMQLNSVTSIGANPGPAIHLDDIRGELFIDRTTITNAGAGIEVSNSVNGLVANFGDTTINTAAGGVASDGVRLTNNAGALIEFQGLDVSITGGTGFRVRDGGTVNFSGELPLIVANGGTAIDIDDLTRGQTDGIAGWTFDSITSGGGGPGIRLNNIADDFTVLNTVNLDSNSDAGILITGGDTAIQFSQVNITNRQAVGIQIEDIDGTVRIATANIDNANGVAGNAVNIIDTFANGNSGVVEIRGGLITDAENDGVHIENSIATIANVSIRAPNATEKHDGISVVTTGINDAIVLLQDNTVFLDDGDVGVRLLSNGTGTLNATLTDNLLRGNETLDPLVDNIASIHATSASGTLFLNAVDNHDGDGTSPTNPIRLENLGGTLDVTQTSAGNLSALNNNVDVEIDGVVNFGAGNPPLPPPVPAN